jgi:hypothetical protein
MLRQQSRVDFGSSNNIVGILIRSTQVVEQSGLKGFLLLPANLSQRRRHLLVHLGRPVGIALQHVESSEVVRHLQTQQISLRLRPRFLACPNP